MSAGTGRAPLSGSDATSTIVPTVSICVLGLLFALEVRAPLLVVGGILSFTNVEILMLLVVAIWAVTLLKARRRPEIPLLVIVPALCWGAALLASTINSQSPIAEPARFSARMISGVILGWLCFDTVSTSPRPTWIARSLAAGGTLVAIFGLAEVLNVTPITAWLASFKFAPTRVGDILRVSATLSYATITSMVLELTFPLLLAWFISSRRPSARAVTGIAGTMCLAVLVLTLSRAGVIALGAALLAVVAAAAVTRNRQIAIASGGAVVTLVLMSILSLAYNPDVGLRLTSESDQSWYNSTISVADHLTVQPGEQLTVPVTISNLGAKDWSLDPAHPYALGYHLYGPDHGVVTYDGARTPLKGSVAPGDSVRVDANLTAPGRPGTYDVQWDLVQNGVTWFSWKGSPLKSTQLTVSGAPIAGTTAISFVPAPSEPNTLPVPGRLKLWTTGLQMLREHPILGVGPDNFRWQYGPYARVGQWNTDIHANNLYVELLADTGVMGFLAFAWLVWRLFSASAQGLWRRPAGRYWVWRVAALASLTAWFVHGLFDYFYEFTPTYVAFWMIAGLALGLARREAIEGVDADANADRI